jgi:hypothetical protein
MTKFGILGAAALVASALASPAMAQEVIYNPGYCAQFYPNANCQNKGPGNPYTGSTQREVYRDQTRQDPGYRPNRRWHDSYNRYDNDGGFWPGDVAAGVVGGAVGTAAAIATAPIGAEAYARRNGFVCIPGSTFRGEDGRMHLCQ